MKARKAAKPCGRETRQTRMLSCVNGLGVPFAFTLPWPACSGFMFVKVSIRPSSMVTLSQFYSWNDITSSCPNWDVMQRQMLAEPYLATMKQCSWTRITFLCVCLLPLRPIHIDALASNFLNCIMMRPQVTETSILRMLHAKLLLDWLPRFILRTDVLVTCGCNST